MTFGLVIVRESWDRQIINRVGNSVSYNNICTDIHGNSKFAKSNETV